MDQRRKQRVQFPGPPRGTREKVTDTATEAARRTGRLVAENPASSAGLCFCLGCGLGVLTALAFMPASPRRRHWYDVPMPQWASRHGLTHAIERLVPEAVSRYLAHH